MGIMLPPLLITSLLVGISSSGAANAATISIKVGLSKLGKIVVTGRGMSAYFYDLDKANSGKSACVGACLKYWPPVLSPTSKPFVSGLSGHISTIATAQGKRQITINGRPLYTFSRDRAPGDINGQGSGGLWHLLTATGREIKSASLVAPTISPVPTPSSSSSYVYKRSY